MSMLRKALPQTVRELRLHCCQTSAPSQGARSFIQDVYPSLKQTNPELPVLIRQAAGVPARAFARFERGVERQVALDGADSKEVERRIESLLK